MTARAHLPRIALAALVALAALACSCGDETVCAPPAHHGVTVSTYHGSNARLGWNDAEPDLTPAIVSAPGFGPTWTSAPFDAVTIAGVAHPGRMYASPLYADDVTIHGGTFDGQAFDVLFAATTNGDVYALSAIATSCSDVAAPAGTVLWKASLATPSVVPGLDGGVPIGVLSTPVLDPATMRLYVVALDAPSGAAPAWRAYALDATSGAAAPGFPVTLDAAAIEPVNTNGPCAWDPDATLFAQRSALALAPGGDTIYVPFASYDDLTAGWIVAVDTRRARVSASFSAARMSPLGTANGGMWGAAGPAIEPDGTVLMTTGNGPPTWGPEGVPHAWGDALVAWSPALSIEGTYAPWNYCLSDAGDADVGGNAPALLPDLSASGTSTPRLVAFGSKQGNVYLVERDALPGGTTARPPCSLSATWADAGSDTSLLPPAAGPPYCDPKAPSHCVRGPLNVFGPYSDVVGANEDDTAKMRSTPAFFADASGAAQLFVAGVNKAADDMTSVPPSLVRLRVSLAAGQPAYLAVDGQNGDTAMLNPGSPVVSSHGSGGAVVWVVDENAKRTQLLTDPAAPAPVLYAFDGETMARLWRSGPADLTVGGKYVEPVVAHGTVFVGTDRIQAFGPR